MPVRLSEAYGVNEEKQQQKPHHIRTKRKNYTMIEDFDFVENNYNSVKDIGTVTPSPTITTAGPYGYNSDDIVTSQKNKVYAYPPQNYMMNNSMSNFPPQYVAQFKGDKMREVSFNDKQIEASQNIYPTSIEESGGSPYPAGTVPPLNNASGLGDKNAVMSPHHIREGYNQIPGYYPQQGYGMGCMNSVNHVMNCPMCSRYFKCDTRVYNIVIFMVVL
jgi:hypothetical protein